MQETIKINGVEIYQPDNDLGSGFETTFTADSGRVQSGKMHATPMFTVEQFSYLATDIPIEESSKILKMIVHGRPFTLHYFSPYYGMWRDDKFRVGKGSLSIGSLKEGEEKLTSLSFNMTGDNPI